jgi:hypothetical protein
MKKNIVNSNRNNLNYSDTPMAMPQDSSIIEMSSVII